ncbi:IS66 family insertion sequence element accessory protein TnpB [Azotobacter chroococcum]
MKVLVHDGFGVWLASRRLNRGRFVWPGSWQGAQLELSAEQLQALVVGLPWQRVGSGAEIRLYSWPSGAPCRAIERTAYRR